MRGVRYETALLRCLSDTFSQTQDFINVDIRTYIFEVSHSDCKRVTGYISDRIAGRIIRRSSFGEASEGIFEGIRGWISEYISVQSLLKYFVEMIVKEFLDNFSKNFFAPVFL